MGNISKIVTEKKQCVNKNTTARSIQEKQYTKNQESKRIIFTLSHIKMGVFI